MSGSIYRWGSCWFLVAAVGACGNASDTGPSGQGGAGAAGLSAEPGGSSNEAGASGSQPNNHGGAHAVGGSAGTPQGSAGQPGGAAGHTPGASGTGGAAGSLGSAQLVPVVKAFCAAARACCSAESIEADLDGCESMFPSSDQTFAALESGAVTIDQAGLAACLAAYQAAATKCEANPVLSACKGLVHGLQKENEKCTNVAECARAVGEASACVISDQAMEEGVCAKVPRGKLGDACLGSCNIGDDCSFTVYGLGDGSLTRCFEQDGLYCSSDTSRCATITALGAPCDFDDCGSANYCDTTCKKRSVEGEPCTQTCLSSLQCVNGQCLSPSFVIGSTCSGYWFGPY